MTILINEWAKNNYPWTARTTIQEWCRQAGRDTGPLVGKVNKIEGKYYYSEPEPDPETTRALVLLHVALSKLHKKN